MHYWGERVKTKIQKVLEANSYVCRSYMGKSGRGGFAPPPSWIGLILKLTNKLDLRIGEKVIALSNLSIYYTWRNIKNWYNNNKFKISAPTWTDKFELPDGAYSVSDIQDYLSIF